METVLVDRGLVRRNRKIFVKEILPQHKRFGAGRCMVCHDKQSLEQFEARESALLGAYLWGGHYNSSD
jgi:hypothetical protein